MPRHNLRDPSGRFRRREMCGRGPCAALEGHEGSCEEASGWVELNYEAATDWYRQARPAYERAERRELAAYDRRQIAAELNAQIQRTTEAVRTANQAMRGLPREYVRARWYTQDEWQITVEPEVYAQQYTYNTATTTGYQTVNYHWNQGTGATGIRWQYDTTPVYTTAGQYYRVVDREAEWCRQLWREWQGPYIARREERLADASQIWMGWVRNVETGERVEMNIRVDDRQIAHWDRWNEDFEENIRNEMRREFERHMRAGTRPQWELTDEQREEIERAEQERRDREQAERERVNRERLAREQLQAQARERAMELLMMVLTPEERLQHENTGEILVRGSDGHLYNLQTTSRGTVHGNIVRTDEHGCRLGTVCVAPKMHQEHDEEGGTRALPIEDGWVGQYLGLRHNAEEFLARGNWSYVRPCQNPGVPAIQERLARDGITVDREILEEMEQEILDNEADIAAEEDQQLERPPRPRFGRIFGAA